MPREGIVPTVLARIRALATLLLYVVRLPPSPKICTTKASTGSFFFGYSWSLVSSFHTPKSLGDNWWQLSEVTYTVDWRWNPNKNIHMNSTGAKSYLDEYVWIVLGCFRGAAESTVMNPWCFIGISGNNTPNCLLPAQWLFCKTSRCPAAVPVCSVLATRMTFYPKPWRKNHWSVQAATTPIHNSGQNTLVTSSK